MTYVGRFAPSPTGPLHIGSLVAAVASYLHARQVGGQWLVRMEDIDPPREAAGAADAILRTLEAFSLHWDGAVLHQSTRREAYHRLAQELLARGAAFLCSCTRSELRAARPVYPGRCRGRKAHTRPTAVRVRVEAQDAGTSSPQSVCFKDHLQGLVTRHPGTEIGDYVIWRRDGLPAYHLAVVADDAFQGVTDVVRGCDLLESTSAHVHLQSVLGLPTPRYYHLPIITNDQGQKLSKQTGAPAVETSRRAARSALARSVLEHLGLEVPNDMVGESPAVLWAWAAGEWHIEGLRGRQTLTEHKRG